MYSITITDHETPAGIENTQDLKVKGYIVIAYSDVPGDQNHSNVDFLCGGTRDVHLERAIDVVLACIAAEALTPEVR